MHTVSLSLFLFLGCTRIMSYDQSYPYPQVFVVDGGQHPEHPAQPPGLVPCWSYPPARERARPRVGKGQGCMGVSPGLALVVLLLFLLTFAALGFEAHQIFEMQKELRGLKKVEPVPEVVSPQKQIDVWGREKKEQDRIIRAAAHVIGRIETSVFPHTLRWEQKSGEAFTSGGVTYSAEDGALQVNRTGLYHVYSRVELVLQGCAPTSFFEHSLYVRRKGQLPPVTLTKAHRSGFCSQWARQLSWTTESYLGSIHQLKAHDRVYVNVSHPLKLSHSHEGNFFGLYMI